VFQYRTETFATPAEDGDVQVLLAFEVVVDGGHRKRDFLGDVAHVHAVVAFRSEQFHRGRQYVVASAFLGHVLTGPSPYAVPRGLAIVPRRFRPIGWLRLAAA